MANTIDIESLLYDYARAWVSLHTQTVSGWSKKRIIDAFYLLPEPEVSFGDWCKARVAQEAEEIKPEAKTDVEQGEGWAVANTEEGKKKIEAQLNKLERLAKGTA